MKQAIPMGLQHVLAMFVGNLTPILIISGACGIAGGSYVAMKHSGKVQILEAESEKELYDIDTPEDLEKIML